MCIMERKKGKMVNQEIVLALQEYIQMEQRLSQLLQQKNKLEKEIKHYQIPREQPEPQRPSKIGTFFTDLVISFMVVCIVLLSLEEVVPQISDKMAIWLLLGTVIFCCILTPIHYKRKDSEACARYVTAGMRYNEWETGKRERLPVLQNQLGQVMNEGCNLYQKYQNARIRTFLHADYLPYCEKILGYFNRGRVSNLTEAVNLLEQELREYRRDMETAAYREEMRQQAYAQTRATQEAAEQSRQAATAAQEAAFWGAAATFVAAVAATESKKN